MKCKRRGTNDKGRINTTNETNPNVEFLFLGSQPNSFLTYLTQVGRQKTCLRRPSYSRTHAFVRSNIVLDGGLETDLYEQYNKRVVCCYFNLLAFSFFCRVLYRFYSILFLCYRVNQCRGMGESFCYLSAD